MPHPMRGQMNKQQALDALKIADQRITELCNMVCTISGNPEAA
jgi:hypothetical protein